MTTQTVSANITASSIAAAARFTLQYGQMLVEDISDEQFTHMPHPNMNHPAFCLGHLSIYPDHVLKLIGKPDLASPCENFEKLFAAGVECPNQPDNYPTKSEIVAYYLNRYNTAFTALDEINDDILRAENPAEGQFKEMLPTIGSAVNFLLNNHPSIHLGQISAWRRAVGLPSVM